MDDLGTWCVIWIVATVLNAVPAFMPPTWSLLAYFHLRYQLSIWPLALIGAAGAVIGRALLARGSRMFGMRWMPAERRKHIEALSSELKRRRALSIILLALFGIGPIPTNHLFIAAGLAKLPLLPVVGVFGVTRCVSYLLWVKAAETAAHSLRDVITPTFGSAAALAVQVVGVLVLVLLFRLDWMRLLQRWMPPTAH